jgi:hypothetical protein
MLEGVMPFALNSGGTTPYIPFLQPVSSFLTTHCRADGEMALANTLDREDIRQITDDDKTLIWALRLNGDARPVSP